MLLGTFWGPKALHFLMRFLKSFLGVETDRRVSGGTSTGLRRDFDAAVSPTDPPLAAPSSRTEESNNDRKERKTRDPTRPGPEARRILGNIRFAEVQKVILGKIKFAGLQEGN